MARLLGHMFNIGFYREKHEKIFFGSAVAQW